MHQGMGRAAEVHHGVIVIHNDTPFNLNTTAGSIRFKLETLQ
jgi:hypothetical protein